MAAATKRAAADGNSVTVTLVEPVWHDGLKYAPGKTLTLDAEAAADLFASGAALPPGETLPDPPDQGAAAANAGTGAP